jgi:alpha-tubulin suppressor-like RCC1 family protein
MIPDRRQRVWIPAIVLLILSLSVEVVSASPAQAATDRDAWAWGDDQVGELGTGLTGYDMAVDEPVRVSMPDGVRFASVSAGPQRSFGLTPSGDVWAWGDNGGRLGDGTIIDRVVPTKIAMPSGVAFTQISTAVLGGQTLALDTDGRVWAWGSNVDGELGDGTTSPSSVPIRVSTPPALTFTKVAAGSDFSSFALASDGSVWAWGSNADGRLGDGSETDRHLPVQVALPTGFVATDISDSMALGANGTIRTWGTDLGNGTTDTSDVPVRVTMPQGVTFASLGGHGIDMRFAVDTSGAGWSWGTNVDGILGLGSDAFPWVSALIPTEMAMPDGVSFATITAGSESSAAAVDTDGRLWTWGSGGQLGNRSAPEDFSTIPAEPLRPSGVTFTSVAVGEDHDLAAGIGTPPTDNAVFYRLEGLFNASVSRTFRLQVAATGSPGATTFTNTVPSRFRLDSVTSTSGGCSHTSSTATCQLDTSNGAVAVELGVTPTVPGTFTNDASIAPADPTPQDDSSSTELTVRAANATKYVDLADSGMSPASVTAHRVQWSDVGPSSNGVEDASGLALFDSGPLSVNDTYTYRFTSAGTYPTVDSLANHGRVRVVVKAIAYSTSYVGVVWGDPAPDVEDVQIAYCATTPCAHPFKRWMWGTSGSSASVTSGAPGWQGPGTYFIRARRRDPSSGTFSGWSPVRTVAVTSS